MSHIRCHFLLSGLHVEQTLQNTSITIDVYQLTPAVRLSYNLHQNSAACNAALYTTQALDKTRSEEESGSC